LQNYINEFFNNLQIWEDYQGNKYKDRIYNSLSSFIFQPNVQTATLVYQEFFSTYWIGIQQLKNPFVELIEMVRKYEFNAGKLLLNHRDHYIHSVNVFILGLAIFSRNSNFRSVVTKYVMYPDSYSTHYEEFFYRWGLCSLFHDIAYPLEITYKQANEYIRFIHNYPKGHFLTQPTIEINLPFFEQLVNIPIIKPSSQYSSEFYNDYPDLKDPYTNSLDLLAQKLASCFNINLTLIKDNLFQFVDIMKKRGFIDHGYYSSLIMLQWYHSLITNTSWHPAYFYYPIVDSSSSILLHNYYKQVLMKPPFNLGLLNPNQHPLAFLLMLCDELQDWNRKTYGENDNQFNYPIDINFTVNDDIISAIYIFTKGSDNKPFIDNKKAIINSTLDTQSIIKNILISSIN